MVLHKTKTSLALGLGGLTFAGFLTICAISVIFADEPTPPVAKRSAAGLFVRLWTYIGSSKPRGAVIEENTLYLAGKDGGIEAVNLKNGRLVWKYIGSHPLDSAPTVLDDKVHFLEAGKFVAISNNDGREISRTRSRIGSMTPVYPNNSLLVVGATNDRVCGIDPATGRAAWHLSLDDVAVLSTWNKKDMAYLVTASGMLYGVLMPTQEIAWKHSFKKPSCSPPTYYDKALYIGNEDFFLYAMDAASGDEKWRLSLSAPVLEAPVATDDRVYATTTEGILYAIDIKSHDILWQAAPCGKVLTTTKDHVIALRSDNNMKRIIALDSGTGQVINEIRADGYNLFVSEPTSGIFYAITPIGEVSAFADRGVLESAAKNGN